VRVVFFGTPAVAVDVLRALLDSRHEVVGVVTQPDRPRGRHGTPQQPPVKALALEHGLAVLQPDSPKDEGFAASIRALSPDAGAVAAYGHLLPRDVLAVPPRGTLNVHFSLLPKYRGAAPIQRAIMAGERETGVSVFLLEPTLDTGPVILQAREPIAPDDTAGSLLARLAPAGAGLLVRSLELLEAGSAQPIPQDPSAASSAPKIRPEEAEIDWANPAERIVDLVRALNPAPGAHTWLRAKRVKVWRAAAAPGAAFPGAVLHPGEDFVVAAGRGAVRLLELQPEGKRPMRPEELARGWRLRPGDRFGPSPG
jgi:methionyl-tRNA formyltransferase